MPHIQALALLAVPRTARYFASRRAFLFTINALFIPTINPKHQPLVSNKRNWTNGANTIETNWLRWFQMKYRYATSCAYGVHIRLQCHDRQTAYLIQHIQENTRTWPARCSQTTCVWTDARIFQTSSAVIAGYTTASHSHLQQSTSVVTPRTQPRVIAIRSWRHSR